jgi:beta-lactamase class A
MVATCHAPQLLLTTLSRISLDHTERLLILQVLTRLLQFGDNKATHHLLDRIGLLTWLQAFLVSNTLHEEVYLSRP